MKKLFIKKCKPPRQQKWAHAKILSAKGLREEERQRRAVGFCKKAFKQSLPRRGGGVIEKVIY
ncbi:MAG: hypothetical protein NC033_05895 [Clostridiales bacterium]|nr:hypothetical protein [Clostridiales bacterium]